MDLVPTVINAAVIAVVGTLVALFLNAQTKELKKDLKAEIAEVKQEMRDFKGAVRAEFAALRSDLTQVALAVGAQPRQTG